MLAVSLPAGFWFYKERVRVSWAFSDTKLQWQPSGTYTIAGSAVVDLTVRSRTIGFRLATPPIEKELAVFLGPPSLRGVYIVPFRRAAISIWAGPYPGAAAAFRILLILSLLRAHVPVSSGRISGEDVIMNCHAIALAHGGHEFPAPYELGNMLPSMLVVSRCQANRGCEEGGSSR